ncbi:MAG: acyl-[acyl-carrier-protein]--UDP-N-acetylglucosamine O-acyltransferase, partial [Puniceicoccales bacterium]|nr:acyl-[acyl-carrier-protein]--UDP-N-acetylglucosamine O-acyltransferase [Puniceicoccales bacterium]
VCAPNFVNLKRNNFSEEEILQIKRIFKIFYLSGLNRSQAAEAVATENISKEFLNEFLGFISGSTRGCA